MRGTLTLMLGGTCTWVYEPGQHILFRVPLEIPHKFLTMLLTFGSLDQFLTAVSKGLKTNVNNKLEIDINCVFNSQEVKNC